MSKILLNVRSGEEFTALVQIDHLDSEEEIISRKISKGISLNSLLHDTSKGALSLGKIEINLDFDANGQIVQIEIYS